MRGRSQHPGWHQHGAERVGRVRRASRPAGAEPRASGPGLAGSTVSTTSPYCHVAYGVLTQLRGLATYTIPKVDVQVSGVMQSKPGALLAANYAFPAAQVAAALGRPVAGNPQNVTVNILEPGSRYGDRVNQLDFRAAKILRFGGAAFNGRRRSVQRAELERGAVLQQHVRSQRYRGCSRSRFSRGGWRESARSSSSDPARVSEQARGAIRDLSGIARTTTVVGSIGLVQGQPIGSRQFRPPVEKLRIGAKHFFEGRHRFIMAAKQAEGSAAS